MCIFFDIICMHHLVFIPQSVGCMKIMQQKNTVQQNHKRGGLLSLKLFIKKWTLMILGIYTMLDGSPPIKIEHRFYFWHLVEIRGYM